MRLKNKVIVVTGGAGLLGRGFVKAVLENGGIAIIAERRPEKGEKFERELSHPNAAFFQMDITSKTSVTDCLGKVVERFGKVDAVVNNAYPRNPNYGRTFSQVEYSDFCENLNSNLGGYFLVSQQAALQFQKQGFGNIVNISSIYGVIAPRFEVYDGTEMTMPVEYAVIKSGLIHLTKYMAKYLKGQNIRVNSISPGGVKNNQPERFTQSYNKMSLNKGMLEPADVAGALMFLLSDDSLHLNGQNIIIDDGFSL